MWGEGEEIGALWVESQGVPEGGDEGPGAGGVGDGRVRGDGREEGCVAFWLLVSERNLIWEGKGGGTYHASQHNPSYCPALSLYNLYSCFPRLSM